MRTNIKATNIELTPEISAYVEKKLSAIEKFLEGNTDAVVQVEVGKTTEHHRSGEIYKAEAHVIGGGIDIYVFNEQADLYAAIDKLKDELVQKLSHIKGKKEAITRRGARMFKDMIRGLNPFKDKDSLEN